MEKFPSCCSCLSLICLSAPEQQYLSKTLVLDTLLHPSYWKTKSELAVAAGG